MTRLILILSSLAFLFGLSACEVLPTAKFPDGSYVTGGGTIFTKSQYKNVNITHPNGLMLNYNSTGHDETAVPAKVAGYYGIKAISSAATSALRTTESTKRVLAREETSRAATRSAADLEKVRILNPAETPPAALGFDPATGLNTIP